MTLTELRYIVALHKTQHFGQAAEMCFVSQPTLSVAIKKLEEKLGVALFERSRHKVWPTEVGEQVVAQAVNVLAEADTLNDIAAAAKSPWSQPLRVGAIFTIGPYLLPHMLPRIKADAPDLPLVVEENYTGELRKRLRAGELDAIVVALPFSEPDVLTVPLYDEPFVVLLPEDHPLAQYDIIKPEALLDERLLLLGEGHCFRDQVLELCPNIKETTRQIENVSGTSLETIKYMVATGLGITVLPKMAAEAGNYHDTGLVTREIEGHNKGRTTALAWRASFPRPQVIDVLRASLSHPAES